MNLQLVCTDLGREPEVRKILAKAIARRPTDDGVLIEFPNDDATARTLMEFVLGERRCCAHFTYEIAFEPTLVLRLSANGLYRFALKAMYLT
jgi:hypothetical protein